ncbi:GNAT family N-acetyltransferase [candidate division KSB1 bacterium]|nr:GNAT family N-acetyltransferase [candidate division KSB1 bacterium]
MITIEKITNFDDANLKHMWTELLAECQAPHIFLTYEWLSTWWESYGVGKELAILVAKNGETIVAIAPLMIVHQRFSPVKTIEFVGTGFSDYHDFIIREAHEEVLSAIFDYLDSIGAHAIRLRHIPEWSANLPVIRKVLNERYDAANVSDQEIVECPYIQFTGDWESYFNSLPQKFRADVRRRIRRIEENGELKYIRVTGNDENITKYLEQVFDLHQKNWESRNFRCFFSFANSRNREFVKKITERFADKNWYTLLLLIFDDQIVAYTYGFTYNNTVSLWNTSYDLEYVKFAVGKIVHRYLIEDYITNGFEKCDFMRGVEPYKMEWCNSVLKNYEISIYSSGPISKITAYYYLTLKPYLETNDTFNRLLSVKFISKLLGK